jgi:hypothetical protein
MEPDSVVSRPVADAEGRYSNFFKIGYNAFEFLVDFGQAYADGGEDSRHTRIVMIPTYAKALSELLIDSLRHYENNFGPIPYAQDEEAEERSSE